MEDEWSRTVLGSIDLVLHAVQSEMSGLAEYWMWCEEVYRSAGHGWVQRSSGLSNQIAGRDSQRDVLRRRPPSS